jgi:hypothetical protein
MKKEILGGVGKEADQEADGRNCQLRYCELIAQHFEVHDLTVVGKARRRASTSVDVLFLGTAIGLDD